MKFIGTKMAKLTKAPKAKLFNKLSPHEPYWTFLT